MEHDLPVVLKLSKVKTGSSLYFSAVRYFDLKSDLFYNTKSDAMVNTEQKISFLDLLYSTSQEVKSINTVHIVKLECTDNTKCGFLMAHNHSF